MECFYLKEYLTLDEINTIKNREIREIRERYWHLRRDAFVDEYRFSDEDLENVFNRLKELEEIELSKYKKEV